MSDAGGKQDESKTRQETAAPETATLESENWKNMKLKKCHFSRTDPFDGFLLNKAYDGTNGPSYEYTSAGRLKTRTWARGITTTYTYDAGGSLANIDYSDSTPSVSYTYDRLGRQQTVSAGGITSTLAYNLADQALSEAFEGGVLGGLTVTNRYDNLLRRSALSLNTQPSALNFSYGYDAASRLQGVTNGAYWV